MNGQLTLGRVVATRGVAARMAEDTAFAAFVTTSLMRYNMGDWGDLCEEDESRNCIALLCENDRILASYTDDHGCRIWIITEWDRSATTILFPDEY